MPLSLIDVARTINPVINDAFIGLKKTFNSLKTEEDKIEFLTLCLELVEGNGLFQFRTCSNNTNINNYFNDISKCFINSKQELFANDNHVKANDQPAISLFSRIAILKSLYEIYIENTIKFPTSLLEQMIICIQQINRSFALLPNDQCQVVTLKGQPVNSLEDIDRICAPEIEKMLRDRRKVNVTFYLPQLASLAFVLTLGRYVPKEVLYGILLLNVLYLFYLMATQMYNSCKNIHMFYAAQKAAGQLSHVVRDPAAGNKIIIDHFIISSKDITQLISEREDRDSVNKNLPRLYAI